MRRVIRASVLWLAAALPVAGPSAADPVPPSAVQTVQLQGGEVSVPRLQQAAVRAIQMQRYDLAAKIANVLLEIDPTDSYANFVLAHAHLRGGDAVIARKAAGKAFRYAQTDTQKHEAARAAAAAAARQEQFFAAQIWMRRAMISAPSEQIAARTAREFRGVRHEARLSFDAGFSLAPSSNVNGGASERISTVDGLPLVGVLSPTARALSGTVAEGQITLGYRLHRSETSETSARMSASAKRVWLSGEAQDIAPNAENGDFGSSKLEFGLLHRQALWDKGPVAAVGLNAGRAWFGGDPGYDYTRVVAGLTQPLGARTALSLSLLQQDQRDIDGRTSDVVTQGWQLGLTQGLWGKSRVSLSYQASETESENVQQRSVGQGLRLGFNPGKPLGPVTWSAGLSAFEADYSDFRVLIPVPGGRQDTIYGASLDLTFHKMDYAGFVPTMRLSAERSESNVSRYETEEFSVSLGFKSRF